MRHARVPDGGKDRAGHGRERRHARVPDAGPTRVPDFEQPALPKALTIMAGWGQAGHVTHHHRYPPPPGR